MSNGNKWGLCAETNGRLLKSPENTEAAKFLLSMKTGKERKPCFAQLPVLHPHPFRVTSHLSWQRINHFIFPTQAMFHISRKGFHIEVGISPRLMDKNICQRWLM